MSVDTREGLSTENSGATAIIYTLQQILQQQKNLLKNNDAVLEIIFILI
jgi:hypothetical protein